MGPVDPDVVWGIDEFRLVTIDVAAPETSVIKDFSTDATIGPVITDNPDLHHVVEEA